MLSRRTETATISSSVIAVICGWPTHTDNGIPKLLWNGRHWGLKHRWGGYGCPKSHQQLGHSYVEAQGDTQGANRPIFVKTDMVCCKRLLYKVGFFRPSAKTSNLQPYVTTFYSRPCLLTHSCPRIRQLPPRYVAGKCTESIVVCPMQCIWHLADYEILVLYVSVDAFSYASGGQCGQ